MSKTRAFGEGERVVYFTVGSSHRLVAILRIEKSLDSHEEAASWYRDRGMELPRNLIVPGSKPLRLGLTCGFYKPENGPKVVPDPSVGRTEGDVEEGWEALYRERAARAPHVHACKRVFASLHDPPELSDAAAARVFSRGRFPGTQTPAKVNEREVDALIDELGISCQTG